MKIAVTGGDGFVGRFVVEAALAAGDTVTVLSRSAPAPDMFSRPVQWQPYQLGDAPRLCGQMALVHAAFAHVPGRFRGGEGDDPRGFAERNLDGTLRLFETARSDGVARAVFLSSRAVFDGWPPGTDLLESLAPKPANLYGRVKAAAETAIADIATPAFGTASLRATGVYGVPAPGRAHKWQALFAAYLSGAPVAPRVASEVHGADLARAVQLVLAADEIGGAYHVSDLVLDRRTLLAGVAQLTGCPHPLPQAADAGSVGVLDTSRMRALGWVPGGMARLKSELPALLAAG